MKKTLVPIGLLAVAIAMTACGKVGTTKAVSDTLSRDKAIEIALDRVEGAVKDEVYSAEYMSEDNEYYIEIIHDGTEYSFEIAENGTINSERSEKAETMESETGVQIAGETDDDGLIGIDKAIEIAVSEIEGADASEVVKSKEERDDGIRIYEIEIVHGDYEYEFEIDASDGRILEKDSESIHDD